MILNASQRGGGRDLAAHLMKTEENEHVSLHELRGFAAGDLNGAFREAEAVSRGTRCQQYLFSLSLNPPADARVPAEVFERTVDRIEERLGLQGQPRAVVFHEKDGRRHAHCVWSRIDAATMTARPMSFYKQKLTGLSRDLYLEHGWTMPHGIVKSGRRDPTTFTLAEWQQAKRQGMDPRWLKAVLQDCWSRSDGPASFGRSLEEHGFFLGRGDRRGLVVLDHTGEVWSLPRALGLKTKEVRARLGNGAALPDLADVRKRIGEHMRPAIRRHVAESRERFQGRSAKLNDYKAEMTVLHRQTRQKLEERQAADWLATTRVRADRLPRGLRGLWHRITGRYEEVRRQNEAEAQRQRAEQAKNRQSLINAQRSQRAVLEERFKDLRRAQAAQLLELRREIGRYLKFSGETPQAGAAQDMSIGLKLER
ncbi:relaxase [Xaviernesmea oryzae]|uniref:Relaxase n=1 Tax=Xaviernesmea oryzae TaxID=464029 RepID=A0A1Q9ASC3_9HYPH|nr:relaxase [Xaviernesmea oryzae]OLP58343.1 relaxase [Xaviernesmea oryzae]SEL41146.1 hypothetical protein SAMN04487976_10812 [Xaviernesmea oryzae]